MGAACAAVQSSWLQWGRHDVARRWPTRLTMGQQHAWAVKFGAARPHRSLRGACHPPTRPPTSSPALQLTSPPSPGRTLVIRHTDSLPPPDRPTPPPPPPPPRPTGMVAVHTHLAASCCCAGVAVPACAQQPHSSHIHTPARHRQTEHLSTIKGSCATQQWAQSITRNDPKAPSCSSLRPVTHQTCARIRAIR